MNSTYIKNIIPAVALCLSLGLGSCVGDLDVTPIENEEGTTTMTPDNDALFNKCYANMVLAGQGGPDGDCDIEGLDGGTTGFVRQLFNANELTTDHAICCWSDEGIPAFNYNQWSASHPMLKGFYYRLYFGVTMCNYYLEIAAGEDAQKLAEIRFLRALYYYYLMHSPSLYTCGSSPDKTLPQMLIHNRHDSMDGYPIFHGKYLYPAQFIPFLYCPFPKILHGKCPVLNLLGQFKNHFLPMCKKITSLAALFPFSTAKDSIERFRHIGIFNNFFNYITFSTHNTIRL